MHTQRVPTEMTNSGFFLEQFISEKKVTVFYVQEPLRGESTITECGVNYQLLAVMY